MSQPSPNPPGPPPRDEGPHGDPSRHLPLETLDRSLAGLPPSPRERGRVVLVVARRERGVRECPERVRLSPESGVPGDAWNRRVPRKPDAQITVMEESVAKLIANEQPLTLFGDNLFFDLDLSAENLPAGARLRAGSAVLAVTPEPHDGCRKFRSRFGGDALRFVSRRETRHRNLRGIYLKVIEAGEVGPGDEVRVLSRNQDQPRG